MNQLKLYSPACDRNKEALLSVLSSYLGDQARILEIASGSGQHADFFTLQRPGWVWQSSDTSVEALKSIEVYQKEAKRKNFLAPVNLSTQEEGWKISRFDASLCCNMIHISPWESCLGLFRLLRSHLKNEGKFFLYGPFIQEGVKTSPSNIAFDEFLRNKNSLWGIRHISEVTRVAEASGFHLKKIHEMPANNLTLVFEFLPQK